MDDDITALLTSQLGLISLAQLRALDVSRAERRWQVQRGWRYVLPAVLFTRPGELDDRQRLVAASLHGGPDSMVASLTAARWHGITSAVDRRVHISVPAARNRRSEGFVRVLRTRHPDPRPWVRGPIRVVSRGRAVIEAARDAASPDQARAVLCEAVERSLVTIDTLRHELEAGPTPGSARARAALAGAEAGAWSVAECDLLDVVSGSAVLPALWVNPLLEAPGGERLPVPDGWFDDVGLAVQVHSWRWHSSMSDWDTTVTRDGIFAEHGVPVIAVTPSALRGSPAATLRRIERAYRQAAGRPRPPIIARPRVV